MNGSKKIHFRPSLFIFESKKRTMKAGLFVCFVGLLTMGVYKSHAQTDQPIYQLSRECLAGEGLNKIKQKDSTRTVYQKKVYDGHDIAIYLVAIGTGITNEFSNFPLEEFIFWMNGKAIIEPRGEEAFSIQTGDYFVQAKGFKGKWNFVDTDGVHLELALVAKDRPDSTFKSPMTRAMILDRDLISGVTKPDDGLVYEGPEITVKLYQSAKDLMKSNQERMVHILNGVLTLVNQDGQKRLFYPGDFFVVKEGFTGIWNSTSIQSLRVLEVFKTKME